MIGSGGSDKGYNVEVSSPQATISQGTATNRVVNYPFSVCLSGSALADRRRSEILTGWEWDSCVVCAGKLPGENGANGVS